MAEGILRKKFSDLRIQGEVDSCGFESYHAGDPPDERAIMVSAKRGIDIRRHQARLFVTGDFDRFDRILVMDSSHYTRIMRLVRGNQDRAKVDYVMNITEPGKNLEVPDPWYHDRNAFEQVFVQLEKVCQALAENIRKNF